MQQIITLRQGRGTENDQADVLESVRELRDQISQRDAQLSVQADAIDALRRELRQSSRLLQQVAEELLLAPLENKAETDAVKQLRCESEALRS